MASLLDPGTSFRFIDYLTQEDRRTLRFAGRRASVLPRLLQLVQPPAPPLGIGYNTPNDVLHHGRVASIHWQRVQGFQAAYAAHPQRFARQAPVPLSLPGPAWINPPQEVRPLRNCSPALSHQA